MKRKRHAAKAKRPVAARGPGAGDRLEREIADAALIQAHLLPAKIPNVPGYDFHAFLRSASRIGGDYYDFLALGEGRLGIVVADASPTGIAGGMLMAVAQTLVRVIAPASGSGAKTLSRVNNRLVKQTPPDMFVTALFAELDVRTHELTVASAGHPPAVIYRAGTGGIELLGKGAVPLGVDLGEPFDGSLTEKRTVLETGDRVVLYTNGLVSVRGGDAEEFGTGRLHGFLKKHPLEESRGFVKGLMAAIELHGDGGEQHDDIALVTFRLAAA